jgi:uncharacterized protein YgfB (UPF0149 family)
MPEDYMFDDQPLDFDDYANQILEQGLQLSPAELHGGICGVLAGSGGVEQDHCLAAVSQVLNIDIRGELAESSLKLVAASDAAMANDEFEFHLFLPDDETEIELRVQALGDWCRGFLATYALAVSVPDGGALAEEVADIIKDVAAIAEIGYEDIEDEEEAERNYFDISEYLRFATLNLYLENAEIRSDASDG